MFHPLFLLSIYSFPAFHESVMHWCIDVVLWIKTSNKLQKYIEKEKREVILKIVLKVIGQAYFEVCSVIEFITIYLIT